KLVHSISIHLIRVICGGSIRDEKQHIPADFSILPVNGYHILNAAMAGNLSQITDTLWDTKGPRKNNFALSSGFFWPRASLFAPYIPTGGVCASLTPRRQPKLPRCKI
ncbi:MAG: hypothetical protein M0Z50_15395, partial [Planctomycetia bacterium]|nr:hypothetical protein [Planctomycetia bacterium]